MTAQSSADTDMQKAVCFNLGGRKERDYLGGLGKPALARSGRRGRLKLG